MTRSVVTLTRHQTVDQARRAMSRHGIHSIPVVDAAGEPIGIVTSTDLLDRRSGETLIGRFMTRKVYTVPRYADVHVAARMMRNHSIHHLVVTDEGKVVGMLSSFDLLALVEDKRFVARNAPSRPKRGGGGRRRDEDSAARDPD